jgi:RNA polymerase sigma-70 factor (ECF subfamily)
MDLGCRFRAGIRLEVALVSTGRVTARRYPEDLEARSLADKTAIQDLLPALDAARVGDETAFRIIYRAAQPGILRYLRGLVGADAEDVASEAWLQISRDLPGFSGDVDGFRGWAATVARNRAMDHLRRMRRRPAVVVPVELLTDIASRADTAEIAAERMTTEDAIALIASLPRDQAEAVLLRVVVGLDAAAAGKVLGKRPGAVRTACYRGLRRLAEQVSSREP